MIQNESLLEVNRDRSNRSIQQIGLMNGSVDFADSIDEDRLDLKKYWHIIRKHLVSILTLTVAVSILTYLILLTQTPIYIATSSLIIEPKNRQKVKINVDAEIEKFTADYYATQLQILKSRWLGKQVLDQLSPVAGNSGQAPATSESPHEEATSWWSDWIPDIFPRAISKHPKLVVDPREAQASALANQVILNPVKGTHIIQISFEDPDPIRAMRIANLYGEVFITSQNAARQDLSNEGTRWMSERLDKLRHDMLQAENKLAEYMESQGLVNLPQVKDGDKVSSGVLSFSASELSDRQTALNEVRKQRESLELAYQQVTSPNAHVSDNLASLPGVHDNPVMVDLRTQEHQAEVEVHQLMQKYGPRHPEIRAAESHLRSVRDAKARQLENVIRIIKSQLDSARANEQMMLANFEQAKANIQSVSRKDSKLNELRRELETNKNLYEMFFNRLKETTETRDISLDNASVLDSALPPVVPLKPNKRKGVIIAAVLAMIAGIGLAILLEQLDTSLKSPEEIEEKLGIPFLGVLPFDQATRDGSSVSYHDNSLSQFSEAVRSIRTGVIFGTLNHPKPVIMITSASPGEGKTTSIINLAASLAQLKRILLIEGDLRKPQLAKRLNIPPRSPGICNLIYGDEEASNCIYPVEENFDVIPCGQIPPNPLEMLASPHFNELIEKFRETYDIIIIDAPPVGPVSDPVMLSSLADSVIFVIRAKKSQVRQVQQAVSRLRRVQAPLSGVVLNFVDLEGAGDYKYGYYNNYYQYGYAYKEYKADTEEDA